MKKSNVSREFPIYNISNQFNVRQLLNMECDFSLK